MKLAIDVYYPTINSYTVVGILFNNWKDTEPLETIVIKKSNTEIFPYISGKFYQRELPPIENLIEELKEKLFDIDTFIIDGYVKLKGYDGKIWNGLGAELYKKLSNYGVKNHSVIGVAKSKFGLCSDICSLLYRGESTSPLWISSLGLINTEKASEYISSMHGDFKIPELLKRLDKETKK